MSTVAINIYLIEPNDKSKYKKFLVFSDNSESARLAASSELNPLKIKVSGYLAAQIDPVYLDENQSTCKKVNVETVSLEKNTVHIKYIDNEYFLTKDLARILL